MTIAETFTAICVTNDGAEITKRSVRVRGDVFQRLVQGGRNEARRLSAEWESDRARLPRWRLRAPDAGVSVI